MPDRTPIRTFLLGATVVAGTVLAFLLLAELAVRAYYSDVTTTSDNYSYFAQRWNGQHAAEMNSWGFRGPEFQTGKPPGVIRIAVIGDSFTFGQGIELGDRLTERLQRELERTGGRFEVLNFGTPGHETEDHIRTLDRVLTGLHPDYVLVQWFVNDVEGHRKRRPAPLRLVPVSWLDTYLKGHSALYFLLNKGWVQLQAQAGGLKSYADYMHEHYGDPESAPSRKAQDEFAALLALAAARGVPIGVYLYPELEETGGDPARYSHAFLFDRTLAQCAGAAVRCLDLRPVLAPIKPAARLWVNEFDHHPSAEANKIVTGAVISAFATDWNALTSSR